MMRRFLVLPLLLALTTTAWAQQPSMSLTLADAEALAIKNNPQISAAQFNAAAADQVPLEYRSAYQPTVVGNVTGVEADSGSRLAAGGLNNSVLYSRVASGISGSELLSDFGRTRNLVTSARLRAQAQGQVTETARADILLATVSAYFAVLRSTAVLRVAQQTVAARQVLFDQVNAFFNSQLKSQLDVSFAGVNLAEAKLLLTQAESDLKSADATLALAIGSPSQEGFSLADEPMPPDLPDSVDPLVQQALQDRPEIKDLRLEQNAAESFATAEKDLNRPTIGLAGAVGIVPAGDPQVPGHYAAIGVNVSVPILNGGLFRARKNEADLRAKAAASRVTDVSDRVVRDVRVAYQNARNAYNRVGLTDQLLQQAQLALSLAQGRYNLGLSSIVELSQAQLSLTSAQIASASARYDYQAQRVVVNYEIGALH